MAARTTGRTAVIHRRRRPGCTDRMTTTASINGHWRRFVCLESADRTTGSILSIVTGSAIGSTRNSLMGELGRVPSCRGVTGFATGIICCRNMIRSLTLG